MLIDHHMHFDNEKAVDNCLKKFNPSRIVLFSIALESDIKNPYKENNEKILNYSKKNEKILPFMTVHPILDTMDYIKKNAKRFSGYKINCNTKCGGYSYPKILNSKVLNYILKLEKPIVFHTGYKKGHRIKDLIPILDSTNFPIIFSHAGRFIDKDLREASKRKNAYVDICPLNTISENPRFIFPKASIKKSIIEKNFREVIKYLIKYFSGRIVWGSDFPDCNYKSNQGYKGELKVYDELERMGENSTFLTL